MGSFIRVAAGAIAAVLVSACGGGGDGGAGSDTSPAAVRQALSTTNISSAGFPWSAGSFVFAPGGILKRWNLPIPVKINGEARVTAALNEIERQLGMTVFDRASISSTPDASITRGLVVQLGTVVLIGGGTICADLSNMGLITGPSAPKSYPSTLTDGVMSHALYLKVDTATCRATQDMIIDAIARAMGMGSFYAGWYAESDGIVLSPLFWRVLQTMYANAPGTPEAAIVVR